MGAQLAGGFPKSKEWIPVNADAFIQVPFPDGFRCPDTTFDRFEETLRRNGIEPAHVAAVIMETYQGGGASFAPVPYVRALATWCQAAGAVLIFDEVQAGFGRTGTLFGFEHYGIVPDLVCLGKAISGALPLSALLGRRALLDIPGPGEVTSTHGGNPLVCASALANIDTLLNENLVERGRETGARLGAQLSALQLDFPDLIGAIHGRGLVYGIHVVQPGGITPNPSAALQIVDHCFRNGLLLFEPVGYGLGTVKICPPLCITADAVDDGCSVLREAFESLTSLAADATRPGRN